MNTKQLNEYGKKLCEDIKGHYLKDYCLCKESKNWFSLCQISMRNFILSRVGWKKSDKSDDSFIFLEKRPAVVNILYSESPGMLMVKTAIEIAKAELVDEFGVDDDNLDGNVDKIVKCIENQDWIIPFLRKKIVE